MRALLLLLALPCLLATACAEIPSVYTCTSSAACVADGVQGVCEPTHWCSFPDSRCGPNGRSYGTYAGDGLAGICVTPPDAGSDAPMVDCAPPSLEPLHLPPPARGAGEGDLALGNVVIDTGSPGDGGTPPSLSPPVQLPSGVLLEVSDQDCPVGTQNCPELAVLRVRKLTIADGTIVYLRGGRPFVVVAADDVIVGDGASLDASGQNWPGAGGAAPGSGDGAGHDGDDGSTCTGFSGGGGAGFGTPGAAGGRGGDQGCDPPGLGGPPYLDAMVPVLIGGSGGGAGHPMSGCSQAAGGGAGGGAIQISTRTRIHIGLSASINVGGGGGWGGIACSSEGSGSGGGSGGAIVLQAPIVESAGDLAANGGGGGGSSTCVGSGCTSSTSGQRGNPGSVGLAAASGGAGGVPGGSGGAANASPNPGLNYPFVASGGGGAVGRILIIATQPFVMMGRVSPAPTVVGPLCP